MSSMLLVLLFFGVVGTAYGHTVDSVDRYRLEIGWMNEPVVSNETNAIELYVSELEPNLSLEEQQFTNGIVGLEDTLKIELVYKSEKIILPVSPDHNIEGKYYGFVNPTVSGFYQANVLGVINDTPISLSMHPPKVEERTFIEFPEPADITVTQIIDGHTALIEDIHEIKESVANLNGKSDMSYVGIILGVAGVVVATIAISRTRS